MKAQPLSTRIRMDACKPAAVARPLEAALSTASLDGLLRLSVMAFVAHRQPFATQRALLGSMYPGTRAHVLSLDGPLGHLGPMYPDTRARVSSFDGLLTTLGPGVLAFGSHVPPSQPTRPLWAHASRYAAPRIQLGRSIGPLWVHASVLNCLCSLLILVLVLPSVWA